jgi:hypothetical protein
MKFFDFLSKLYSFDFWLNHLSSFRLTFGLKLKLNWNGPAYFIPHRIFHILVVCINNSSVRSLVLPPFEFEDGWTEKFDKPNYDVYDDVYRKDCHHRIASNIYFETDFSYVLCA